MTTIIRFLIGLFSITAFMGFHPGSDDDLVRTKSFTAERSGTLDITLNGGDIRITTWDKSEVYVKVRGSDEDDLDRLDMEKNGQVIRISNRSGGGWSEVSCDVTVPSAFNLELRTSVGSIDIHGPLTGEIHGSTSAGDIRLAGTMTGDVDVTTSGGNIRTGNVTGDLRLHTSGGDVTVGAIGGEASLMTSGGNIRVDQVSKSLTAKTSGGDIVVGDVGAEANVSTSGGNVNVGKVTGGARISTAGGDIDLLGATGSVRASTAGGTLRLENISGSIDAKTAGGDISAELIPSGKGSSRLTTAGGLVHLELPERAKATIDARIRVQGSWRQSRDEYHIRSDFEAQSYKADSEAREIIGKYVLNGGGESITLETVNGDIEILKSVRRGTK